MEYATKFINKIVYIKIDRPLGSRHPKHKNLVYKVNYGFMPGTKAPDGEEVDAYLLGVNEPVNEYRGRCIAVIHRVDDNDDKLVVVAQGLAFTDEQIKELVEFHEKFYKSKIIRSP